MRVATRCANHPSREAEQRCRACGKWLCDRCARQLHRHSYCGLKCRIHGALQQLASGMLTGLRSPVPTTCFVTVVVLALGLVTVWSGILFARLHALSTPQAVSADMPYAVAELAREDGALRLDIRGTPGATVVLFANGNPIHVLTLDADGRGSVRDLGTADDAAIEIAALAEAPETVAPPPTLTATSTRTPSPTRTAIPTSTATLSPTSSAPQTTARAPNAAPPGALDKTSRRAARRPAEPTPGMSPPVLHLVTDAGPRIALTFDGNASSNGTAELLDLLAELDLEITLFVTGRFIERYPVLVRRAVLAGHEVGNHTYSHPHLTTYARNRRHQMQPNVTRAWFHNQLRRTEDAFKRATGRPMAPLWRAPYGEENSTLRRWALDMGYLHVRWSSLEGASLDARDWVADEHSSLYQDSRRMMDRLLGFPRLEGGIVLMHLATERSDPPWNELPRFVRELRRRQVMSVRVTELLERSSTWRPWLDRARRRHVEVHGE